MEASGSSNISQLLSELYVNIGLLTEIHFDVEVYFQFPVPVVFTNYAFIIILFDKICFMYMVPSTLVFVTK